MLAAAWRARRDNMPLGRDMKNSCCIDETLKVFLFLGKELRRRHHLESCYSLRHSRTSGSSQASQPRIGLFHFFPLSQTFSL